MPSVSRPRRPLRWILMKLNRVVPQRFLLLSNRHTYSKLPFLLWLRLPKASIKAKNPKKAWTNLLTLFHWKWASSKLALCRAFAFWKCESVLGWAAPSYLRLRCRELWNFGRTSKVKRHCSQRYEVSWINWTIK